jgi:hypothetical protein
MSVLAIMIEVRKVQKDTTQMQRYMSPSPNSILTVRGPAQNGRNQHSNHSRRICISEKLSVIMCKAMASDRRTKRDATQLENNAR